MGDHWYRNGGEYVLVRNGQPQDAVQIGTGDTYAEALGSLQPTPIQSVGRDGGVASAIRWAHGHGWGIDPDGLQADDGPPAEDNNETITVECHLVRMVRETASVTVRVPRGTDLETLSGRVYDLENEWIHRVDWSADPGEEAGEGRHDEPEQVEVDDAAIDLTMTADLVDLVDEQDDEDEDDGEGTVGSEEG